jgi:hypothetical protein
MIKEETKQSKIGKKREDRQEGRNDRKEVTKIEQKYQRRRNNITQHNTHLVNSLGDWHGQLLQLWVPRLFLPEKPVLVVGGGRRSVDYVVSY